MHLVYCLMFSSYYRVLRRCFGHVRYDILLLGSTGRVVNILAVVWYTYFPNRRDRRCRISKRGLSGMIRRWLCMCWSRLSQSESVRRSRARANTWILSFKTARIYSPAGISIQAVLQYLVLRGVPQCILAIKHLTALMNEVMAST